MRTTEINKTLLGKKVTGIFTGLPYTGIVTAIIENEYIKGLEVEFDKPIRWGEFIHTKCQTVARKIDGWGNLNHTELI